MAAEVRAMCAIGLRGQLGLNGKLPWEGNKGWQYQADVARFFDLTKGHVLIAGPATIASIPPLAYNHRTIVEIRFVASHLGFDTFRQRLSRGDSKTSYRKVSRISVGRKSTRLPSLFRSWGSVG